MEKTDNMLRYEKAHDDVRKIFESDKSLDERLNEFNDYLKGYVDNIDGEDNGMIRTLLVIGKSFKTNPIVKDNLEILANKLKSNLNVDFI
jgi:hypothetical protein